MAAAKTSAGVEEETRSEVMPNGRFISGKVIVETSFVEKMGCGPKEEVVPIKAGGRSCQLKPMSSKPSPAEGKKSALN